MPPRGDLVLSLLPAFPSVRAVSTTASGPPSTHAKYHQSARPALSQSPLLTHAPRAHYPPSYSVLTAGDVTCSGGMQALVAQCGALVQSAAAGPSHRGPPPTSMRTGSLLFAREELTLQARWQVGARPAAPCTLPGMACPFPAPGRKLAWGASCE